MHCQNRKDMSAYFKVQGRNTPYPKSIDLIPPIFSIDHNLENRTCAVTRSAKSAA